MNPRTTIGDGALSCFRWGRRDILWMLPVMGAAISIYTNSLGNDFTYDDRPICLEDGRMRDLGSVGRIFRESYWAGSSPLGLDLSAERLDPLYRPATLLSLALNRAVSGLDPAGYRAVNLLLHALVSAGVYALAMVLFRRTSVAVVAGLVFAVHPIHVEAVAPIVGRSELLAACSVLWGMVLFVQDALSGTRRVVTVRYVIMLVLLVMAVFSKESAITVVGLVVGADVWLHCRGAAVYRKGGLGSFLLQRLIQRYLGVVMVAMLFFAARWMVVGHVFSSPDLIPPTLNPLATASIWNRILTCPYLMAKYVYLLIIPYPLSYDYSSPSVMVETSLMGWRVWVGWFCAAAVLAAGIWSARRQSEVVAGIGFFLITYSVASNFVFRIGVIMAERLVYLPSVGACVLFGLAAGTLLTRGACTRGPREGVGYRLTAWGLAGVVAMGCILVGYGVLTFRRNRVWRDNRTLYEAHLVTQPRSHKVYLNLARFYLSQKDESKAMKCLERSLELAPDSYDVLAQLGYHRMVAGRQGEALAFLERAERYRFATETLTLWLRAQIYQGMGRLSDAVRMYEEVLQYNPDHQVAMVNLAAIRADPASGSLYDLPKAYSCAKRAAENPTAQPQCLVALADVCVKMGRREEALSAIVRGLKLLDQYRRKSRELGILESQAGTYDQLERALREMIRTLQSSATSQSAGPAGSVAP